MHKMAECKDWLAMKPAVRWDSTKNRWVCYTCLKHKYVCKGCQCMSQNSVPAVLICKGCVKLAKQRGWYLFNNFLCKKPKHAEIRADYPELKKVLDKYLGKLSPNISESTLCVLSNFMFKSKGAGKHSTRRNNKVNLEKLPQAPSINTRVGSRGATRGGGSRARASP